LELQKVKQWENFNNILTVSERKFQASQELNTHFDQLNKDLSKQVKKQRNLKTFYKIAFGIVVGGLVFQSFN